MIVVMIFTSHWGDQRRRARRVEHVASMEEKTYCAVVETAEGKKERL